MVNLDEIAFTTRVLTPTKRKIVRLVERIYDPLGFLAPVVVHLTILFQELCEAKLDWNQLLPGDLMEWWNSLKCSLEEGQSISIPWWYFKVFLSNLSVGHFAGFAMPLSRHMLVSLLVA